MVERNKNGTVLLTKPVIASYRPTNVSPAVCEGAMHRIEVELNIW
jgi:hypothetical protein